MNDDLEKTITQLWEAGDDWRDVHAARRRRTTAVRSVIGDARPRRGARRRDRRECRRQRVGEARDPHVVPRAGDADHRGRAVRVRRQAAAEEGLQGRGRARRPRRVGPLRRVPRAERRDDAVLRQHRRLRRRGHDGRHVGDGRLVRADRQARAPLGRRRHRRRARTAAGGAGRRRGRLLHRLALHDRRRRAGSAGREARRRADPHVVHPRHRRRDRRGGRRAA